MENKQMILHFLLSAIQATNAGQYMLELKLSKDKKTVTAEFEDGYTKNINVNGDSGWAMVLDVVNHLDLM